VKRAALLLFLVACGSAPAPQAPGVVDASASEPEAGAPPVAVAEEAGAPEAAAPPAPVESYYDGSSYDGKDAIIMIGQLNEQDPTSAGIAKSFKAQIGKLRACYAHALKKKPDLHGKITLKFTVEKDGKVSSTDRAVTKLDDPALLDCFSKAIMDMTFTKPAGISTVILPIVLTAR
jgi:hypothetical protein